MPAASVLHIETSSVDDDCAITALSRYLGLAYADVLQQAILIQQKAIVCNGTMIEGLSCAQIRRVAAALGTPLVVKRIFDPDDSYGIVVVYDHALVLRNGLAFDADGRVWDWDEWHASYQASKKTKWQRGYLRLLVEPSSSPR